MAGTRNALELFTTGGFAALLVMDATAPPTTICPPAADADLPFEQAIGRIEELVTRLEAERLPLDELIKAYDEGTRLLDVCRQRLDDAQSRIDLISQRADGTAVLTPFTPDDAPTAEEGSSRSRQR